MIENTIIIDGKLYPLISFTMSYKRNIKFEFMDKGYLEAKGINDYNEYIIVYFDKEEKEIILKFNPPIP